jgi:hypothetical protein
MHILKSVVGGLTSAEIARRVTELYEVDPETALSDVERCRRELAELGLL